MAGLAQSLNRYAYGVNNPVRWTDHSGNSPDGMSASDATRIGGGESSAGEFHADSQLTDDSYARGMAQQNAGRSYEENASEVPFTQIMREQTQARAMQAQQDVIRGFMTLGTGNRRVELLGRFMYAAGRGFVNGGINLPRNLRDGILGVMNLTYDLAMDTRGTVNRLKEKVTDIAVKAAEIASDPHGTYEKAMDQMTAMGEDKLMDVLGEMVGGMAFDIWSGGLIKGIGVGGKALAMAQETKVGRAVAKVYGEARGAMQSAKTAAKEFGAGFNNGFGQGIKDSLRTASSNPLGPLVEGLEQGAAALRSGSSRIGTGHTQSGMSRITSGWRERYGAASMREHHLIPQALLNEEQFVNRLQQLGVNDAKSFIDRRISRIPNAEHNKIHLDGWNPQWKEWLDNNPSFSLEALEAQIKSMMNEYNIPRGSRNFTRPYGKN